MTREDFAFQGRITDLIRNGKMFADLGVPHFDPAVDRGMICGSSAMLKETKVLLEEVLVAANQLAGPENPEILNIKTELAATLLQLRELPQALQLLD